LAGGCAIVTPLVIAHPVGSSPVVVRRDGDVGTVCAEQTVAELSWTWFALFGLGEIEEVGRRARTDVAVGTAAGELIPFEAVGVAAEYVTGPPDH
jgi:hypothetical protein